MTASTSGASGCSVCGFRSSGSANRIVPTAALPTWRGGSCHSDASRGRLDDRLDPLECLAHIADVAALAELTAEHCEDLGEGAVAHPERLGDVGAPVSRREQV